MRDRKPISALLLAGAMLAAGTAQGQTASPPPAAQDKDQLVIDGRRMPTAEAPRSATCEALARDPYFRAQLAAAGGDPLMGPRIFVPTRLPRNPDYAAPPLAPVGSPLPGLPKSRFGVRNLVLGGETGTGLAAEDSASDEVSAATSTLASMDESSVESAAAGCRASYRRGGDRGSRGAGTGYIDASSSLSERGAPHGDPRFRLAAAEGRFNQARARIVGNDTSLPLAFALFDQRRYGEALDWFRKAADKLSFDEGGDEAMLFVGKIYLQGLGDKSDPVEGVKWLKKAATGPFNPVTDTPVFDPAQPERNTAAGEAAVILANLYRGGFAGIARDPAAARKWYARANAVGHVPAAKMLGDLYYRGIGVPRDAKKAASYYRDAAKLDYAPAQVALAGILYQGEQGVAQDRRKALQWYQAAARHNQPAALYALARAYDLGEGVKQDPQMALGFYKSAALAGDPAAKVAMGTYFYEGKQLPKDDSTARQWFEAGAAAGDSDGMFDLAAMLARGEGGEKDVVRAWVLLRRAAMLGQQTAPRAATALETRMTADERQKAEAMLAAR